MAETPLASLSLTHVHYDPNDPISYLCAWLALVPQGLCVVYATLIWSTREIEILMLFSGQMACEALNFLLKRALKEQRPKQMQGKGYGMPSSHSQFMAFFALSVTLFLLVRHVPKRAAPSHTPLSMAARVGLSGVALIHAGLVAWSRIYLNYHTPRQVIVGCAAGAGSAISWFLLTSLVRRSGLLAWILTLPVTRLFRMRDLVVEEDLCQAGWEKWEGKNASLQPSIHGKKTR
ncbi:hypothetical protein DSL72_008866 [Monilinia vaccinii-corymbosi]|uniref:Dolichyldiphosphatase n=1 Tax=Monilinia vaccinii-corymbosi TaxID=61207 RepID=A0A8A3PQF7_9HELO|nr:hypothetical protein DSL72_008866 [Monilinia vaccinii-corymbosi]